MIVVDANVIVYRFVAGENTHLATRAQGIDPHWVAPPLCRHEFLNVLVTLYRNRVLSATECRDLWDRVNDLLADIERPVDMADALSLALRERVSAYDAQYIALSCSLGVRCLTEDRQLLETFPRIAISLKDFCSDAGA